MDDLSIGKAVIWHIDQYGSSPVSGNGFVNSVVGESERLLGCWTILPPQTDEVIDSEFFSRMKHNRVVCLRAFPDHHNYLLSRQVFGGFLDEVVERRVPLLLSMSGMPGGITWRSAYELLKDYPDLTCILCDTGVWLTDRYTRPLLENYPNVSLETSLVSLGARVVESIVAKYGAGRLVFGSGFPLRYPEAPMLQLIHAEISHEDKKMIASGNLENVISRVGL
jgi:predicted TIM-barrel fold metal-dependent hydrolase